MSFKPLIKRNGQFVPIFKIAPIDWCEFVASKSSKKTNLQRLFIKIVKNAKEFFAKCPYEGTYKAMNFSISTDVISMVPKSTYKGILQITDKIQNAFFTIIVIVSIF